MPTSRSSAASGSIAAVLAVAALSCSRAPGPPPTCASAPAVAAPPSASAPVLAAPAKNEQPSEEELLALLKRRSQEFSDASATNDVAVLERDLDDHVVFINESGEIASKKDLLSDPTPHPENAGTARPDRLRRAVPRPRRGHELHRQPDARPFHGQTYRASFRSTEVWLLEADGWRMISSQTLAVQADPAGGHAALEGPERIRRHLQSRRRLRLQDHAERLRAYGRSGRGRAVSHQGRGG